MKSLKEIKQEARKGDYTSVAAIVRKSASLVRMVVDGKRVDYYNIHKTFLDFLETREKLKERETKRQEKNKLRDLAHA